MADILSVFRKQHNGAVDIREYADFEVTMDLIDIRKLYPSIIPVFNYYRNSPEKVKRAFHKKYIEYLQSNDKETNFVYTSSYIASNSMNYIKFQNALSLFMANELLKQVMQFNISPKNAESLREP